MFAVEALDCDDSFNELEDFGEISTIVLVDDNNFVINSVGAVQEEDVKEVLEESKKDEEELKAE